MFYLIQILYTKNSMFWKLLYKVIKKLVATSNNKNIDKTINHSIIKYKNLIMSVSTMFLFILKLT